MKKISGRTLYKVLDCDHWRTLPEIRDSLYHSNLCNLPKPIRLYPLYVALNRLVDEGFVDKQFRKVEGAFVLTHHRNPVAEYKLNERGVRQRDVLLTL